MKIDANGLRFEVALDGDPSAPVVVLTMGLGMQLIAWPQSLIDALNRADFCVLRYDNRDIGLSSHLDHLGRPHLGWQYLRSRLGLAMQSAYSLQDMADDALGILDALHVDQAHFVGVSMGGMIAQRMAASRPARALSLVSVMSSSGAPGLPGPSAAVTRALLQRPPAGDLEAAVRQGVHLFGVIGSPAYPTDPAELSARVRRAVQRNVHPAGVARQTMAVVADTERYKELTRIACPTLVIHGEADLLVPVACGVDTAARITGARFVGLPGMGHDLPAALADHLNELIVSHLQACPP